MFKLFLVKLLKSDVDLDQHIDKNQKRLRNRRIYERFHIDHKHLMLMNDQDILPIRNISEEGFCVEVSDRCFKRLELKDLYECRLKYLGENHHTQAVVVWKSKNFVGFSIKPDDQVIKTFLHRLLRPLKIGSSLKEVLERNKNTEDNSDIEWFQGDEQSKLFIWKDQYGKVISWLLENKNIFIEWKRDEGFLTGKLENERDLSLKPWEQLKHIDMEINQDFKAFSIDVLMATNIEAKEELINHLKD